MESKPLFVGREQELARFREVLQSERGQAVLVVGQQGMGKTMLVEQMRSIAQPTHPHLKCASVRYAVTSTDSVDSILELMLENAFDAANVKEGSFAGTDRRIEQWRALLNVFGLGDLVMSLRRDPKRSTREQFLERLQLISEKMPDNGRAVFIIDPEHVDAGKTLQANSEQAWAYVIARLPARIKLGFAQRPDDVLAASRGLRQLCNVVCIPDDPLGPLDDEAVSSLLDCFALPSGTSLSSVRQALGRYKGHPYAVPAALRLIEEGWALSDLPSDPTRIAAAQWSVVRSRGPDAIALFKAYAVLQVAVPDEVVESVADLKTNVSEHLLEDQYLGGLVKREAEGRVIYHSILSNHIRESLSQPDAKMYHRRAIDLYRQRLSADVKPDALAAVRLPEHVLAAEGARAFVLSLVNESTPPMHTLALFDAAKTASKRALDFASPNSVEAAALYGNLGLIHRKLGDLDEAEKMHRKALAIDEKLGRLEGMADQYGNLGLIHRKLGDLDEAEKMHRKSLAIEEKLGRLEGMANQYGNLGLISQTRGDLDEAEEMLRKSLEIEEKLGRLEGMAAEYGNLGLIYRTRGDLDEAEKLHRKSLEIEEKLGRLEGMAAQYGNLETVCKQQGDVAGAREWWTKARDLYAKIGMPHMVKKVQGWIDGL